MYKRNRTVSAKGRLSIKTTDTSGTVSHKLIAGAVELVIRRTYREECATLKECSGKLEKRTWKTTKSASAAEGHNRSQETSQEEDKPISKMKAEDAEKMNLGA